MSSHPENRALELTPDHPWPGLATYTEQWHQFFQGRRAETAELFRLVNEGRLTLLFGKSGLGKSSLISAGLFQELRAEGRRYLPALVNLRFPGRETGEAIAPDAMVRHLKEDIAKILLERQIDARPPWEDETLYEYFYNKELDFWDTRNQPLTMVLVLDQFEEIFTLGMTTPALQAASERFLLELGALAEGIHTEPVLSRFQRHPELASACDFYRTNCKILVSLREDFLPHLADREDVLPSILKRTMRLEEMTAEQALEVVTIPGGHLVREGVAEKIVDFVAAPERGGGRRERAGDGGHKNVDPAILCLVCEQLNEQRQARQQLTAEPALIEASQLEESEAGKIIEHYYENSLSGLPNLRRFIEEKLVSDEGHRMRVPQKDAMGDVYKVAAADIDFVVEQRRILVREWEDNIAWLRLGHDRLAQIAKTHRGERALEARALEAERRTRMVLAFAVAALALVMLAWMTHQSFREKQIAHDDESMSDLKLAADLKGNVDLTQSLLDTLRAWKDNRGYTPAGVHLISLLTQGDWPLPACPPLKRADLVCALWSPKSSSRILLASVHSLEICDRDLKVLLTIPISAQVSTATWSPDEKLVAVGGQDGSVQVWQSDVSTPSPVINGPAHDRGIKALHFSPDSGYLVAISSGDGGPGWIWKVGATPDSGVSLPQQVVDATFSGPNLVMFSGPTCWVQAAADLASHTLNAPIQTWQSGSPDYCAAGFAQDGACYFALGIEDNSIRLSTVNLAAPAGGDTPSGPPFLSPAPIGTASAVWALQWLPDGRSLLFGLDNSYVGLYTIENAAHAAETAVPDAFGKPHVVAQLSNRLMGSDFSGYSKIRAFSTSADGRRALAFTSSGRLSIFYCDPARPASPVEMSYGKPLLNAQIAADGNRILVATKDGDIEVFDVHPRAALPIWLYHEDDVKQALYCPTENALLTLAGTVLYRWPVDGSGPRKYQVGNFDELDFDCEGSHPILASAHYDAPNKLEVWMGDGKAPVPAPQVQSGGITNMQYSDATGRVATLDMAGAHLWLWNTARQKLTKIRDLGPADGIALAPQGNLVFTYTGNRGRLWQITDQNLVADSGANEPDLKEDFKIENALFSPDGNYLSVALDQGNVHLLGVKGWQKGELDSIVRHTFSGVISDMAFSSNGARSRLAVATSDRRISFLDLPDGTQTIDPLLESDAIQKGMAFSTDGREILTRVGHEAHLWDLASGTQLTLPFSTPEEMGGDALFADGHRLWAQSGNRVGIWAVPLSPPEDSKTARWLTDLVEAYTGREIDSSGAIRDISDQDRYQLLQNVQNEAAGVDLRSADGVVRWLSWPLDKLDERPVAPGLSETRADYIHALKSQNDDESRAEAARLGASEGQVSP